MLIATAPLIALALTASTPLPSQPLSWVTLPNGVAIRYFEQGNPRGEPLVLLHGFTDSWQSYARILPLLPDRFHVIAIDLRGHGGSDRPASGFGIDEMAEDVALLLGELDLDGVTVVGHSMGSFVAREVARRAAGRVSRLVMVGSAAHAGNAVMHALREAIHSHGGQVPADFIEEFQRSTFMRPLPDQFVADVIAASSTVPPRVWRGVIDGLASWDDRHRLARLRLPTLLMWGEHDAVFARSDQEALLDAISGARLVAFAGTGHAPHWELPQKFVTDLVAFLDEDQERR